MIQSLSKGLEVLEHVGAASGGLRLKEIAAAMGMKPPTAHNFVKTLSETGFLVKGRDQRYQFGPALHRLLRDGADHGLLKQAEDSLQRLHEHLSQATVTFAVLRDTEIQVLRRISPDRPQEIQQPAHQRFGIYSSATGLAYLAFSPEEDRLALMEAHPFYEEGVALWGELAALESQLAETREAGVAVLPFPEPILRIAAPVLGADGTIRGTLGVSIRGASASDAAVRDAAKIALQQETGAMATHA